MRTRTFCGHTFAEIPSLDDPNEMILIPDPYGEKGMPKDDFEAASKLTQFGNMLSVGATVHSRTDISEKQFVLGHDPEREGPTGRDLNIDDPEGIDLYFDLMCVLDRGG